MTQQENTPLLMVESYYALKEKGDIVGLKRLMTHRSYIMMIEALSLKFVFKDPVFKQKLKLIDENEQILAEVEEKLSLDLRKENNLPKIKIIRVEKNGPKRQTVYYSENGHDKRLYFSKEKEGWQINYYAGRRAG
jgi:hypothetical protein